MASGIPLGMLYVLENQDGPGFGGCIHILTGGVLSQENYGIPIHPPSIYLAAAPICSLQEALRFKEDLQFVFAGQHGLGDRQLVGHPRSAHVLHDPSDHVKGL